MNNNAQGCGCLILPFVAIILVCFLIDRAISLYSYLTLYSGTTQPFKIAHQQYKPSWFVTNDFKGNKESLALLVSDLDKYCAAKESSKEKMLACDALADIYDTDHTYYEYGKIVGMKRNKDKAVNYKLKAENAALDLCQNGDFSYCRQVITTTKYKQPYDRAFSIYIAQKEKECSRGDKSVCKDLAKIYLNGHIELSFRTFNVLRLGYVFSTDYDFYTKSNPIRAYEIYDKMCRENGIIYERECKIRDSIKLPKNSKKPQKQSVKTESASKSRSIKESSNTAPAKDSNRQNDDIKESTSAAPIKAPKRQDSKQTDEFYNAFCKSGDKKHGAMCREYEERQKKD